MYDVNGKLTRAGAEQAIKEGGVVTIGKTMYSRVEQLPPETEFAVGDAEATQKALDGLKAQRAQLDEQEKRLLAENARVEQAKKDAAKAQAERERAEAKAKAGAGTQSPQGGPGAPAGTSEPEAEFAGRPLSAYDGKSDEELDAMENVGPATVKEIRAAQKDRDRKRQR